jgi:hypothetical protein
MQSPVDYVSDRETIVPVYSKDVAVDFRRRRVGVASLIHDEDNSGHRRIQAQVVYPNCSFAWSNGCGALGSRRKTCARATKPPTWRAEGWLEMLIHHRLHSRQGPILVCEPPVCHTHPSHLLQNVCSDQTLFAGPAHPPIDPTAVLPPPVTLHLFLLDNKLSICSS